MKFNSSSLLLFLIILGALLVFSSSPVVLPAVLSSSCPPLSPPFSSSVPLFSSLSLRLVRVLGNLSSFASFFPLGLFSSPLHLLIVTYLHRHPPHLASSVVLILSSRSAAPAFLLLIFFSTGLLFLLTFVSLFPPPLFSSPHLSFPLPVLLLLVPLQG
jgi:hypothetical protein